MPLPSSGNPISLYQMADYANDAQLDNDADTSSPISINDANIRGLINKSSGLTMSFSEWHGVSAVPAKNIAVTVGSGTYFYSTWTGHAHFVTPVLGSASVSAINNYYLPVNYRSVYHTQYNNVMNFRINQGSNSDAVFKKLIVNNITYTRSTASYAQDGNDHYWFWNNSGPTPFSSAGSLDIVKWYVG